MSSLDTSKAARQAVNHKADLFLAAHHVTRLSNSDDFLGMDLEVAGFSDGSAHAKLFIEGGEYTCESPESLLTFLRRLAEYFGSIVDAIQGPCESSSPKSQRKVRTAK